MLDLIKEIEASLKNNNLRCALGMALTLPDICGQIEYPSENGVGKRYTDWCEKYLFNQGFHSHVPFTESVPDIEQRVIKPEVCFKLRCAYLHSGNLELNQRNGDDFPKFRLIMSHADDEGVYSGSIDKEPIMVNDQLVGTKDITITIDIRHLTKVICNAAKDYYDLHVSKELFQSKHIDIIDISRESEKVRDILERINEIDNRENFSHDYDQLSEGAKRLLENVNNGCVNANLKTTNKDGEIIREDAELMIYFYELLKGGFVENIKKDN